MRERGPSARRRGCAASRWSTPKSGFKLERGNLCLTKTTFSWKTRRRRETSLFDRGWLNKSETIAGACCDHAIRVTEMREHLLPVRIAAIAKRGGGKTEQWNQRMG